MAIISLNIPAQYVTRISNILPRIGYVFDSEAGTTDNQQKEAFLKDHLIQYLKQLTLDQEKGQIFDIRQSINESSRIQAEVSASSLATFDTTQIT